MNVISIGRNPGCKIVIADSMISRQHALIKIYPTGKYEIISMGANGTKVNGNLIAPHQPYPLKRGDSVTFAQVANLDWKMIPDPIKPYKIGGLVALISAVLIICLIFLIPLFSRESNEISVQRTGEQDGITKEQEQLKDSTAGDITEKEETLYPKFAFPEAKNIRRKESEVSGESKSATVDSKVSEENERDKERRESSNPEKKDTLNRPRIIR